MAVAEEAFHVHDAKVNKDERWNRKLTGNFQNKKVVWKEMNRRYNGKMEKVKAKDTIGKRWAESFERLLNVEEEEPVITAGWKGERNQC